MTPTDQLVLPASPPSVMPAAASEGIRTEPPPLHFTFTGSGKEYFRIWIVNLFLTFATFGAYSAWAKVRRQQYFMRNTRLASASFDFHGKATTILKGRLLIFGLLATYQFVFQFSRGMGILFIGFLLLFLPWMLRSALRFRAANTSYRGIRFAFTGSLTGAYLTFGPIIVLCLVPTAVVAVNRDLPVMALLTLGFCMAWPWLHARVKRYQHAHLCYGSAQARYESPTGDIFATYFYMGLISAASITIIGILVALLGVSLGSLYASTAWVVALLPLVLAFLAYGAYLLSGPYVDAQIFNLAWKGTAVGQVTVRTDLKPFAYVRMQSANTLLTLASLGLFRPFAVVRLHACRLQHVRLCFDGDPASFTSRRGAGGRASGESASDFLGIQLSW